MNLRPASAEPEPVADPVNAAAVRLSPESAQAIHALHAAGDRLRTESDGWQLELRSDSAPVATHGEHMRLAHSLGEIVLSMQVERDVAMLGDAAWQDFDGEARTLAWTLAHEPLLAQLSGVLGQALLPKGFVGAEEAAARTCCWISFDHRRQTSSARHQGCLGLDQSSLRALLEAEGWEPDNGAVAARRARIRLPCELLASGPRLTLAALRGIVAGDVLVLGTRSSVHDALRLRVTVDAATRKHAAVWAARLAQGALTLTKAIATDEASMSEATQPTDQDQGNDASDATESAAQPGATNLDPVLSKLPMKLDIVLDTLTLTLAEIEQLAPGQVLPLPRPLEGAMVRLRVNGADYSEGELVAIGDTLGVRVLRPLQDE